MAEKFDLDALAEELTPVRPVNPVAGAALAGAITLGAAGLVWQSLGMRDDVMAPMFLVRSGLLVLLAAASLAAVAGMARPSVGVYRGGWRWAVGAGAVVPAAAFVTALAGRTPVADRLVPQDGVACLVISTTIGVFVGTGLVLWLRRGAPVSPERAGLVTGLAAGSLGTFAFSLHCPHDDIVYFGLWYTLAIGISTALGRILVPRLIRW